MKKVIVFVISFFLLLLTGCFNPVFYGIQQDVPPEDASVSGVIRDITRYTVNGDEYLVVAADGGIRYKLASEESHVTWNTVKNLPFKLHYYDYYYKNSNGTTGAHVGQQILKTAADENTLYMLTVSYENSNTLGTVIPAQFYLYAAQVTDWDDVTWEEIGSEYERECSDGSTDKSLFQFYESSDYYYTRFNFFSTNEVQPAHRKVFIRSGSSKGNEYYQVSGKSIAKIADPSPVDNASGAANGAAYFGGNLVFFTGAAVCSDESASSASTKVYYGKTDNSNVFYWDGTEHKLLSVSYPPSCFAVTSDALLIGRADYSSTTYCNGGIVKISITDGVPGTSLVSFKTNAASQLSSSYLIFTLLSVDPTCTEEDAALYSSIGFKGTGSSTSVTYDNIGLWSYYKSRGNWNRE